MANKADTSETIEVNEINTEELQFNVLGMSPMIMNRYNQKAWRELLLPAVKNPSRATLESTLKHDPVAEFRGALYRNRDEKAAALIHVPNGAFHGALAQAGVDMPGAARSKLERLTSITDVNIDLFGVPQLFMAMVRNSGMNRPPDVRTRPIFPEWACAVTVRYVTPLITRRTIVNLLGAAGVIVGIGDWRPQKGGSYGTWQLVSDDDARFRSIVKKQARAAQQAAFDKPACYDADSEELLAWLQAELERRDRTASSSVGAVPRTRRRVVSERANGQLEA